MIPQEHAFEQLTQTKLNELKVRLHKSRISEFLARQGVFKDAIKIEVKEAIACYNADLERIQKNPDLQEEVVSAMRMKATLGLGSSFRSLGHIVTSFVESCEDLTKPE